MRTRVGARHAIAAATAVTSLATLLAAAPASADHHDYTTTNCPEPESLVAGTAWHRHRLAPGVVLSEGQRADRNGHVDLHVLDVDVTNKHVSLTPLVHRLAQRTPLSRLAAGRSSLVAATNTGYFDFDTGTPLGPLVDRAPLVASATKATAVGVGTTGLMQVGQLALTGAVASGGVSQPLVGLNVVTPETGLTGYTSRWGTNPIPLPSGSVSRYVTAGRVTSGTGHFAAAPPAAGYLLVARGSTATTWLSSLRKRASVNVTTKMTSDTARPFRVAYAVGSRLVHDGVEGDGFTCRRRYPQPARTAIGYADGGRRLLLVVAADDPGTPLHGLDSAQLARVMHDLGATDAYLFDGSGSTELLARMPKQRARLSMRNFPADGVERPMPLGFGIFKR